MGLRNHLHQLEHSMVYQDTATSNTVLSFFKTYLPKLTKPSVIIMDNASYHKSKELQQLFEQHNHLLIFLPPYSPDLNPIENLWGTIKQHLHNYYDYSLTLYENLCNVVNLYSV
jgi:transposase